MPAPDLHHPEKGPHGSRPGDGGPGHQDDEEPTDVLLLLQQARLGSIVVSIALTLVLILAFRLFNG
jgi:hypothetical protein